MKLQQLAFLVTMGIPLVPLVADAQQQPIRIGATMSQTGNLATQGVPAQNGYQLCQKDINAKGGVLGRKIEFLIYDDKSDPKLASELYEKLMTEDKVDAVMGPYGSTHTEAVASVIEKHRKVHVSPLAATRSISTGSTMPTLQKISAHETSSS
jgi:branched-chain amino acid transport system substrate-binding protein